MEYEVLAEHLLRDIDIRHIRPHRVAVVVGRPVLGRLRGDTWPVLHKRIVDIDVDGGAVALGLPAGAPRRLGRCSKGCS